MTTQTDNTVSSATPNKQSSAAPASKFVADLNDEINQMLAELNNVNIDSSDDAQWFEQPEYELDGYSTDYDDSETDKKSHQHKQNKGFKSQTSKHGKTGLTIGNSTSVDENEDQALWNRIDTIRDQMDEEVPGIKNLDGKIALGASVGLTAGIVSWFLRGGALLASLMSSVPFLNRFDPVPILKSKEKKPVTKENKKVSKKAKRKSKR
jgi:hypothetical protein